MNKVRLGIVGIGNMGSSHSKNLLEGKVEGMTLAAVCDVSPLKHEWANENLPNVPFFDNYKDMFASGLIDAVLIATPHYDHSPIAIDAFAADLHVLSEKPAGVYTRQAREMTEAAKKSGKVFSMMFNQRTNPAFQKARELVQGGALGKPMRLIWIITNWYRTQYYYDSGSWRATWAGEGGGVLLNQCPHNLDLWQWIFGMPSWIDADCTVGKYHDVEIEDDVTIRAGYENGASAIFITTTGEYPGTNRLEITGDKGKLVIEDNKIIHTELKASVLETTKNSDKAFDKIEKEEHVYTFEGKGTAHVGIMQNFCNAILHGEELLAPGPDGINELTISNAAYLSSWLGKRIELPLDEAKFEELLNERRKTSRHKEAVESKLSDINGSNDQSERWEVR